MPDNIKTEKTNCVPYEKYPLFLALLIGIVYAFIIQQAMPP
jgi:hypothetical protein